MGEKGWGSAKYEASTGLVIVAWTAMIKASPHRPAWVNSGYSWTCLNPYCLVDSLRYGLLEVMGYHRYRYSRGHQSTCYDIRHVLFMLPLFFPSIIPRGLSSFLFHASIVTHMLQRIGPDYKYGTRWCCLGYLGFLGVLAVRWQLGYCRTSWAP
jgi:hypothetical protein